MLQKPSLKKNDYFQHFYFTFIKIKSLTIIWQKLFALENLQKNCLSLSLPNLKILVIPLPLKVTYQSSTVEKKSCQLFLK